MAFKIRGFFEKIWQAGSKSMPTSLQVSIFSWNVAPSSWKARLMVLTACFALCFLGLAYRLISVASSDYVKSQNNYAKNNNYRKEIVDRHGNLLAVNLPSSSLFATPAKVINPADSIEKLAKIIPNLDKKKLLADLKSNKNFVWVQRDLSPKDQAEIFNLGLPGFDFEKEQKRIYTFSNLLSHVIGYVGRDFTGLAGLEKSYDKFLANADGGVAKSEQDKPLQLSIDVRLQSILSEEIDRVMRDFKAAGAVGVIADPNNGEILAMVSKPDFDPHHPSKATPEQLFNMPSLGVYESGSIFKGVSLAIGLDTNATTIEDAYDISYMRVGRKELKDYHPMRGFHTVPEIFLHSSNIGLSQITLEVGKDNLKKYLKALGLFDQLQIELPERGTPLFPSDSRWSDLTTVTMSFGYALSISPLHFVQAMIPVTNGG